MTAAELFAIVERWPAEARPPRFVRYDPDDDMWNEDDDRITTNLAILAHEASAVRWLLQRDFSVFVQRWAADLFGVGRLGQRGHHDGRSLIDALDAALKARNEQ